MYARDSHMRIVVASTRSHGSRGTHFYSPPKRGAELNMDWKIYELCVLFVLRGLRICASPHPILHDDELISFGGLKEWCPPPQIELRDREWPKICAHLVLFVILNPRNCALALHPLLWKQVWKGGSWIKWRNKFKGDDNWWQWLIKSDTRCSNYKFEGIWKFKNLIIMHHQWISTSDNLLSESFIFSKKGKRYAQGVYTDVRTYNISKVMW